MTLYILLWLLAVSGLSLTYLVGRRLMALRRGGTFHSHEPSLHVFVKPTIDYSAFRLATAVRSLAYKLFLQTLHLVGLSLSLLKYGIIKLEQRFAKVIKSVRGQGAAGKRGSVSVFLRELSETN